MADIANARATAKDNGSAIEDITQELPIGPDVASENNKHAADSTILCPCGVSRTTENRC